MPAAPSEAAENAPVTSLAAIEGRWEIARFGGFEPSWRTDIAWRKAYVHVGDDHLSYAIGCNHSGSRVRLDRSGRLDHLGDSPPTLMGCPVDAAVDDGTFFSFFRTGPTVTWNGADRLRLSNGRVDLILERPELRRRANAARIEEISGRWVPVYFEDYSGSGMSGFSMEEPRGVVTLTPTRIAWSLCPEASVAIVYSDLRLQRRSEPGGSCRLGERPGHDGATQLMRLMRSNPKVDRTGENSIVLFTDIETVHLESERSVLNRPPEVAAPAGETPSTPPEPLPPPPP